MIRPEHDLLPGTVQRHCWDGKKAGKHSFYAARKVLVVIVAREMAISQILSI